MSKNLQGQARTDGNHTALGIIVQESLLPAPVDLEKFKEIDPSIVTWMMQYADKEQETRIKAQEASIKLEQDDMAAKIKAQEAAINFDLERIVVTKSEHGIVKTSLWLAFLIAVLFIGLSVLLIFLGQNITGTVFGGVALVLCVQAFLKFGSSQKR